MKTTYQFPAFRVRGVSIGALLFSLAFLVCLALVVGVSPWVILSTGGMLVGINTVTYSWPVAGTTAPTASVSKKHQTLIATITGDNSATSFSITHNWALTVAELAAGFPLVFKDSILAAGNTAAAVTGAKTTNAVAFTNTAFTGAGLQITLMRPWSAIR